MIILWDLHEVVFQRNNGDWLKTFLKYKKKKHIIQKLSLKTTITLAKFILSKCKLSKKEVTSEELLTHARTAKNDALIELVHAFSSHYKPNTPVAKLIKTLHANGFTQHIGSNIGPTLLATFHHEFPDIMNCFSYAHIVTCSENNKTIKKPDPLFFETYLKTINVPAKEVLFIDDKQSNVSAAQKLGIQGIVFESAIDLEKRINQTLF